jgi:Holliday junction resolvase RusA-like endonuclease
MNIFIPGEFTTANEYIAATNANRYEGAKIKKIETNRVMRECHFQRIPPISVYPVALIFTWIRISKRSDPDNIAFAVKFVLDGLQKAGVLKQDTWKSVSAIIHQFKIDKNDPGVLIEVKP